MDTNSGPFIYVRESNQDNINGDSGKDRYDKKDIQKKYGTKVTEMIGKSGHLTFFEARGLHRGKLPLLKPRVAIIVNFSLHEEYGHKDNYSRVSYEMNNDYDDLDMLLLSSSLPIFK